MKNEETPIYLAFLQSVGQIFEAVLFQLQHKPSLIHILYPPMCDLITEVLNKFVRKKYLYEGDLYYQSIKDVSELVSLDL